MTDNETLDSAASEPNIFHFAPSELSQDAVLAYILSWAHPRHKNNSKLHKLGQDLLWALLRTVGKYVDRIENVVVRTQDNHIDVSVSINDSIFLIIEDKTNTGRHGGQIARYKEEAAAREENKGKDVVAVYFKTGNESHWGRPEPELAGCFFRKHFLEVLGDNPSTGNVIIENFRDYLQEWEDDTQSFGTVPMRYWSWRACQGYYQALEEELGQAENELKPQDVEELDYGWSYTANPAGGFLDFWWGFPAKSDKSRCRVIFQIQGGGDGQGNGYAYLYIRLSDVKNDDGEVVTISSDVRWDIWEKVVEPAAEQAGIKAIYSGRSGGWTANVAQLYFDGEEPGSYLATDENGKLDFVTSIERTKNALKLLNDIRDKIPDIASSTDA